MESFKQEQDDSIKTPESEQEALRKKVQDLENENALLQLHVEYLEEQHGIDSLTGVKNRRYFERELEYSLKLIRGEINEHRTHGEPLKEISLVFVDLDHFKQINDTYGHPVGDEVLQKVSALLKDSVRETDVVARVGGEEFVVLLRGADESIAVRDAEYVREKIAHMTFDGHPEIDVTASFGVVSSKSSRDAKMLYEKADQALYEAKRAGRNQVVVGKENEGV
ncbi:MAG: GGDEF domain-containing protein [Patescibacteria group bacterium]|nr:GGDEF domain-containing protein [Patescibacteria group bacterium]